MLAMTLGGARSHHVSRTDGQLTSSPSSGERTATTHAFRCLVRRDQRKKALKALEIEKWQRHIGDTGSPECQSERNKTIWNDAETNNPQE